MAQGAQTAFFSYCREDSDFALRLAGDLKIAGASVWLDQIDITPGQRWDSAVEEALAKCPRMLVILSPAAVNSINVMDEVSFALEEKKIVVPVMHKDCTVPFRLRRVHYVDFRQDYVRGLKQLLGTLAPEQQAGDRSAMLPNVPNQTSVMEGDERKPADEDRRELPSERHVSLEEERSSPGREWHAAVPQQLKTLWQQLSFRTRIVAGFVIAILLVIPSAMFVRRYLHTLGGESQGAEADSAKEEFYSAKDRLAAIQAATIYVPRPVSDADILLGPTQNPKQFQFHPDDRMTCDFATPGSKMGGKTPKFACKIMKVESKNGQVQTLLDVQPVQVKFGAGDNDVYAEVVSTRLMWALGFYADSWFPVHVVCNNCPANPVSGSGPMGVRTFETATVPRKYPGRKMYETGQYDEGWSWKEFDASNGRPKSEKDALKLLAAFIQHSDNKPSQQRLVCDKVKVDQSTIPFTTTCDNSKMIVQDVGATFGGGGSNKGSKMNLENWSGKKLWKKAGTPGTDEAQFPVCQAILDSSTTDGLSDPTISEEGRRMLAGLMCQLTDEQIQDLFKAARVSTMPKYHNADESFKQGLDEATIEKQWVEAFKAKREDLARGRCRWNSKPADLTLIDNPAGLARVPNHCSAPIH